MIDIEQQIKCVEREIGMRESVYPRWVNSKKMSGSKAQYEIEAMKQVKQSLEALIECYSWLSGMLEVLRNEHREHNINLPVGNFEKAMQDLKNKINGVKDESRLI